MCKESRIQAVRYGGDNYAWIIPAGGDSAIVIDPGSARAVEAALTRAHIRPIAFLCTHSDSDHTMGLAALAAQFPEARIAVHHDFADSLQGIGAQRITRCHDNEVLGLGAQRIACLETPGHCGDSMCFLAESGDLFTGDTLFGAGCGRVRGNAYEAMARSLSRLAALPPETRVYPGHDYLEENLRFAKTVSAQGAERIHQRAKAAGKEPPSTIALELETNPFLVAIQSAGSKTALEAFTALRIRKNNFT